MKILIATGIFPPDIGGPATYSKLLFDELPKYGVNVEILNFGFVRRLPRIIRHFFYFLRVLRKGNNADIIFAQDPVSVGLPSMLAAKILGKRFFLKIVGDYAWEQYQQNLKSQISNLPDGKAGLKSLEDFQDEKFDWLTELRRKIQKFVANKADKIIVPSEYLKKIVLKWGIDKNKIKVIYNALDIPEIKITKEEARKKLNLSGTILISIGRLVPWKGFTVLIEIVPSLLKEFPDLTLYIIGDGPDKEYLKSQILNLKLEDKIILIGKLPQEKVFQYIKASDVFVLNTSYEGFSHQLLEVLALGTPIITTMAGGNVEIIEHEKNGFFIPYNDKRAISEAISTILNNRAYADKLSEEGFKSLKMFTEENMFNELCKLLK